MGTAGKKKNCTLSIAHFGKNPSTMKPYAFLLRPRRGWLIQPRKNAGDSAGLLILAQSEIVRINKKIEGRREMLFSPAPYFTAFVGDGRAFLSNRRCPSVAGALRTLHLSEVVGRPFSRENNAPIFLNHPSLSWLTDCMVDFQGALENPDLGICVHARREVFPGDDVPHLVETERCLNSPDL